MSRFTVVPPKELVGILSRNSNDSLRIWFETSSYPDHLAVVELHDHNNHIVRCVFSAKEFRAFLDAAREMES